MLHNCSIGLLLTVNQICQIPWKSGGYFSDNLVSVSYGHDKSALVDLPFTNVAPGPSWLCWDIYLFDLSVRI